MGSIETTVVSSQLVLTARSVACIGISNDDECAIWPVDLPCSIWSYPLTFAIAYHL